MVEPLLFNDTPMELEPTNITMSDVVRFLKSEMPCVVDLQPGDATRYQLLLVPCGSRYVRLFLGVVGIPPESAGNYLFVAKINGALGQTFINTTHEPNESDFEDMGGNTWTMTFLAWWFANLNEALGA